LFDDKFYPLTFSQALKAVHGYGGEMHKYVWSILTLDKPITFFVVEPFDGSNFTLTHFEKISLILKNTIFLLDVRSKVKTARTGQIWTVPAGRQKAELTASNHTKYTPFFGTSQELKQRLRT